MHLDKVQRRFERSSPDAGSLVPLDVLRHFAFGGWLFRTTVMRQGSEIIQDLLPDRNLTIPGRRSERFQQRLHDHQLNGMPVNQLNGMPVNSADRSLYRSFATSVQSFNMPDRRIFSAEIQSAQYPWLSLRLDFIIP